MRKNAGLEYRTKAKRPEEHLVTRYNGCSVSKDAPRTDRTHASHRVASCCTWRWPSAVGRQQVPLEMGVGDGYQRFERNYDPQAVGKQSDRRDFFRQSSRGIKEETGD